MCRGNWSMKFWIVYKKKFENTVVAQSMFEAAKRNNVDCEICYFEYFSYVIENNEQKLLYKSKEIALPDVALMRGYEPTLYSFLEKNGIKLLNSKQGAFTTLDKFESHLVASKLGIPQPKTICGKLDFEDITKQVGLPFIMKNRSGSKGENVFLINSQAEFEEIISAKNKIEYIYQEYIAKSKGKDLRIYFVGDKIAGAVKRICTTGDFRSNVSLGATSEKVTDLSPEIKKWSTQFAEYLDLHFCSVDFLLADEKYLFCEANSNAGFSAFFDNGMDMQQALMEYVKKKF